MFRSFSSSWQLVKASWAVLQADRELFLFPVISAIAMTIVMVLFLMPLSVIFGLIGAGTGEVSGNILGWIMLFLWYLVTYTVGTYFNVGLVGAAMIRLDGGDPTINDGFRIANERISKIIGYAAISATVGVILRWIEDRGFIGQIVSGIIGIAWSLATFLVVPILVTNDIGPIDAVKKSGSLLKETWGEQITGNFSIGGIFFLIYLAVIAAGIALIAIFANVSGVLTGVAVVLMIVGILVVAVIQGALSGVYQAALYRFAETGTAPDNFDVDIIRNAFKPKRKRGE